MKYTSESATEWQGSCAGVANDDAEKCHPAPYVLHLDRKIWQIVMMSMMMTRKQLIIAMEMIE